MSQAIENEAVETPMPTRAALWQRVVLTVVTALLAFAGLGAWAIASPVGAAPDDDFHLASIWCSWGDREGLCAEGGTSTEREIPERLLSSSACFAQKSQQSAQCPLNDTDTIVTERGNFAGNYPPIFYTVMGVFAGTDIAMSTVLMRLFNAAIFVGAVTAVLALVRPGQRGPLIWSGVVVLVPLGVFIIASVNPSSWALLAGLTVWLAIYGYFTADSRARRIALAAIAVVLAVMGAGARGDSAVYVAFAAFVAAVLSFEKTREWLKLTLLPLGVVVIGAFFFLTSSQSVGAASVGVIEGPGETIHDASPVVAASPFNRLIANAMDLPWLWTGGSGTWGLGWLDTPVPPTVWVVMIGAIFAVLFWGLRVMTARKGIVLAIGLLALTVIPLYVLWGMNERVGAQVQPRYLMPLLLIVIAVACYGFARDNLGISRLQAALLFAMVALANSLSLHNNMRRYISGLGDGSSFNLNANIEWWWDMPLQPMTVWVLGSGVFALMLAGLWLLLYPRLSVDAVSEPDLRVRA